MSAGTLTAWLTALFLASSMFAHDVALRLILLFAGAACALVVAIKERASVRWLPPIWLPFVLWGAWAALSIAWSQEPARSLKEVHNEVGYTALALFLGYVGAQSVNAARVIVPVVAGGAVILCSVALHHFLFSADPTSEGWHGGPGHLSMSLLTLLPGVLAVGWYAWRARLNRWIPRLAVPLALFIGVAGYTTLARTLWLAFSVQIALMLVLFARRRTEGQAKSSLKAAAAVAAVIVLAGVAMTALVHVERGGNVRPLEKDQRLALWKESLDYIAERPWTGYGFGRGLLRNALREETGDRMLWHSHNLFIDAVLQTGIPGLLLLLLLLGATMREGWRASRDADDATAAAGVALVAVVCGMVIRNMTDLPFLRHNALLYWGTVGVLLAWGRMSRTATPR